MVLELLLLATSFLNPGFQQDKDGSLLTTDEVVSKINTFQTDDNAKRYLIGPASNDTDYLDGLFNTPDNEWENGGVLEWHQDESRCGTVANVSNAIPIQMLRKDGFTNDEVKAAIALSTQRDLTTYGGCGPIATMGIIDYFARSAGYRSLISDPDSSASKIQMGKEVLDYSQIMKLDGFAGKPATAELPQGMEHAFNNYVKSSSLEHFLEAKSDYRIFGGGKQVFLTKIKRHIDNGLPVSLCTGLFWERTEGRLQHIVNVYAYETWVGHKEDGTEVEKTYLKVRMNFNNDNDDEYYDADILDYAMVGIVTYDILKYPFDKTVTSSHLAFYANAQTLFPSEANITSPTISTYVNTKWVCVKDEDLVLTPSRSRRMPFPGKTIPSEDSFLQFSFAHDIHFVEFETFLRPLQINSDLFLKIDCYGYDSDDEFPTITTFEHRRIRLIDIPRYSFCHKKYRLILPRLTQKIRFTVEADGDNNSQPSLHIKSFRFCYL